MLILNAHVEEQEEVAAIHSGLFPLPNLDSPLIVSKKVALSHGRIIGTGVVKLTSEGIIILDESCPAVTRARAAKEIIESLRVDIKALGLEDCHVFVRNPNIVRLLESLEFQKCVPSQPMVIYV